MRFSSGYFPAFEIFQRRKYSEYPYIYLCFQAGQVDFESFVFSNHLIPGEFGVSAGGFTTQDGRQSRVYARFERRVVVDAVYNRFVEGVDIALGAAGIEIYDVASSVSGFIAENPDATCITCFEVSILSLCETIAAKLEPVLQMFAPMVQDKAVGKFIGHRKDIM